MIKGIGTDLLAVARIQKAIKRHGERFISRILTPQEQQQYQHHKASAYFLAKRFAAKEAMVKALGTGFTQGISWQHMQIVHSHRGQPTMLLSHAAQNRFEQLSGQHIHLSITDETTHVMAFVIIS